SEGRDRVSVIARLGLPALVGGDDEAGDGCRAESGEHVREELPVPGHLDEGELAARGQARPRDAEVYEQSALPLLGTAVGRHSGQGADEGRLPVIDVPGGGDDEGAGGRGLIGRCVSHGGAPGRWRWRLR